MILFLFLLIPSFLSYKSFVKSKEDTVFGFLFFGYLSYVITSMLHILFVFVGINVSISAEKWGMIIFFACCVSILVVHLIRSVRNTANSYKKNFYQNNELKNKIEKTQQNTDESLNKVIKHMNEYNDRTFYDIQLGVNAQDKSWQTFDQEETDRLGLYLDMFVLKEKFFTAEDD